MMGKTGKVTDLAQCHLARVKEEETDNRQSKK